MATTIEIFQLGAFDDPAFLSLLRQIQNKLSQQQQQMAELETELQACQIKTIGRSVDLVAPL